VVLSFWPAAAFGVQRIVVGHCVRTAQAARGSADGANQAAACKELDLGNGSAVGGGRAGVESSEQESQTQALARLLEQ